MRIIGIDPGLTHTGWGIIDVKGNKLSHVANGTISTKTKEPLAKRLVEIYEGLKVVIALWEPEEAAVEETFVNQNPMSALKLGKARGIALMTPSSMGLPVGEYPATLVKKSIVGSGHATKDQMQMMVKVLLPGIEISSEDSADALAIAICHTHHIATHRVIGGKMSGAAR